MHTILFSLIGIFFLGLFSSFTDIKYNKIPNKLILLVLMYSIITYITFNFMGSNIDLFAISLNLVFAILAGYLLYYFNIWVPGDGKLFFVYALLIPFNFYHNFFIPFFPSLILLTNIFVISASILIIIYLRTILSSYKSNLLSFFSRKTILNILSVLFAIFSFSWIIREIIIIKDTRASIFVSYLFAFLLYKLIFKLLEKKKIILGIVMVMSLTLRIFIKGIFIQSSLVYRLIIYSLVFTTISDIIIKNIGAKTLKEISSKEILPHMILIKPPDRKGAKPEDIQVTKYNIGEIRKILKEKKIEKVTIKSYIPLAPLMFISVLITLLIKGEIVSFIWGFF